MDSATSLDDLFPDRGDFRLPLETSIGHRATNEAIELLRTGGVERLSLNTLGKAALYSPSRFHARVGGRAGMIVMLVGHFADRWSWRVCQPPSLTEFAWLPESPRAIDGVRAWHAVLELAHGEARAGRPKAAAIVAETDREEWEFLHVVGSRHCGRPLGDEETLLIQMTLHGLRSAMAAPSNPMTFGRAHATLSHVLVTLGGPPLGDSWSEQNE